MERKIQLSAAFKALEDVDDTLFEDIKPVSILKEGYIKKCHGKFFCSTDEESWEECSEEEFNELKHGGYAEVECDCEECYHEKEKLGEEYKIDLKDENEIALAQKLVDMRKEQDEDEFEEIVELEAEDDDEAADIPHVGKIVLRCKTCGTCIYMDEENIEKDPDNPEVVNKDFTDCPYCHDSVGWEVIGKIEAVNNSDAENTDTDIPTDTTEETSAEEPTTSDLESDEVDQEVEDKSDETNESLERVAEKALAEQSKKVSEKDNSVDVSINELKESRFDSLVNQYLHDIYENVDSYKTTNGIVDDENNKLIVEGLITFKSGKEKATKFIFEAKNISAKDRIKFVGLNETFTKSKNAFTLKGKLIENTLFCEAMTYDYVPLNAVLTEGKLSEEARISGKVANVKEMNFEKRAKIIEARTKKLVEANRDLTQIEGTVAYVLNKHNDQLWAHNSDIEGMRQAVLHLLDSDEIKDKETSKEAKRILSKCKPNIFLSTLATYLTGMRVAPKNKNTEKED